MGLLIPILIIDALLFFRSHCQMRAIYYSGIFEFGHK